MRSPWTRSRLSTKSGVTPGSRPLDPAPIRTGSGAARRLPQAPAEDHRRSGREILFGGVRAVLRDADEPRR